MHWTGRYIFLIICLSGCMACSANELTLPRMENIGMSKSGSRIPAPKVAPISQKGVRYEQIKNGLLVGFDQMGGYLAAVDESTGEQVWALKIYDNKRDEEKEGDVQDVFFKSMTLQPDGTLLIENERGKKFIVDPVGKTSLPIN